MNRTCRLLVHALLCVAACTRNLTAQEPQPRPVVGIALSGGGSLGLAEIGVLRYLEEQHIPVDVIAGTSMGGLIGGLYSTGHDAAYLENLVNRADWQELLRATAKYENLSISEKQEWNRVKGVYTIPLRGGFSLPGGVNAGQALVRMLSGETAAYWDVHDFNDLPIPFRCVATDLISGKEFVLREGHLVEALRATMSLPGIFTPLERDGRLLADGGIVNNLPTNVVRDMGATVVLAVTLHVDTPAIDELRSFPDVVRQAASIAVQQNETQQARLADIQVIVQAPNRSALDFTGASSLIQAGYHAAARSQSQLARLSLSPPQWQAYLQSRAARQRTIPESGPVIAVSAGDPVNKKNAAEELARKANGTFSRSQIETILGGLTAATGLPNAYYGWHTGSGKSGYEIKLEPRKSAEISISPSFFYQLSSGEPGRPTVRLSSTAILKNAYKSRFLGAIQLGSDLGLFLEYYHPHDGTGHFIAPGVSVEHTHFYRYAGTRSDETRLRTAASFYFGIGTWRHLQLRAGARAGLDRYSDPVETNGIESSNTSFVNPEIIGIVNTQDSGRFPSKGSRLNASAGWSFRDQSFPYVDLSFDHFQPAGTQWTFFATGRAGSSLGRRVGFYDQFTLGGLNELEAYKYQEMRGDTVLGAGGGIFYRGANLHDKMFRPIFGTWYQAAFIDPGNNTSNPTSNPILHSPQSIAVGIFAPTPLGIAGATVSFDLKGTVRFRLSIGSFWNRS